MICPILEKAKSALLAGRPAEASSAAAGIPEDAEEHAEALQVQAMAAAVRCRFDEAIPLLQQAIRLRPERWSWRRDLLIVQHAAGHWADSIETFTRARDNLQLDPLLVSRVAESYMQSQREEEAISILRSCAALHPRFDKLRKQLAWIYGKRGLLHEELQQWREIHALSPTKEEHLISLARAEFHAGFTAEAISRLRPLVQQGVKADLHSAFLGMLLHDGQQTGPSLRIAHEQWGERFSRANPPQRTFRNSPAPERQIRIGYISGELARSPSFFFWLPLFEGRNRTRFHVSLYDMGGASSERTRRLATAVDSSRELPGASAAEVASQLERDEIDILIDLSGHYGVHRLDLFSERLAPIQATIPNYPCTTGVPGIDYIVTDRWVCPEGQENQYREQAIRATWGYLPFAPEHEPEIPSLPCGGNRPVSFGIFQRPAKFNPAFWDAVAAILSRCTRSTLLVQYALEDFSHVGSRGRRHVLTELSRRGVAPWRIHFQGPASASEILEVYARVDIALDTFPYNGQTTTCECLWMGVPVISLEGSYHVARVGHSLLHRIGYPELSVKSWAGYVDRAVSLAADRERLEAIRRGSRKKMQRSPLMDGRCVRGIESVYEHVWTRWCNERNTSTDSDGDLNVHPANRPDSSKTSALRSHDRRASTRPGKIPDRSPGL